MKETENAYLSEEFSKLAEKVIEEHDDLHYLKDVAVSIGYMVSNRQKKSSGRAVFADCRKVQDYWKQQFVPFDFLITVYQPNCEMCQFTEKEYRILLYHELLHVGVKENKDGELKFFCVPHDIEEFRKVIDLYGINWQTRGLRQDDAVHAGAFVDGLYEDDDDSGGDRDDEITS